LPARVLCSPALRAAETWRIVAAQLPRPVAADVIDALYDFGDGGGLLDVIRDRGGTTQRLMLVGHNPALENLAARLIGAGDPGLCAKLQAKFPTAALAVIVFPISDWAPLAEGSGELTHFIRPRDLKA
jgi:phosphohistidine phosphatase